MKEGKRKGKRKGYVEDDDDDDDYINVDEEEGVSG